MARRLFLACLALAAGLLVSAGAHGQLLFEAQWDPLDSPLASYSTSDGFGPSVRVQGVPVEVDMAQLRSGPDSILLPRPDGRHEQHLAMHRAPGTWSGGPLGAQGEPTLFSVTESGVIGDLWLGGVHYALDVGPDGRGTIGEVPTFERSEHWCGVDHVAEAERAVIPPEMNPLARGLPRAGNGPSVAEAERAVIPPEMNPLARGLPRAGNGPSVAEAERAVIPPEMNPLARGLPRAGNGPSVAVSSSTFEPRDGHREIDVLVITTPNAQRWGDERDGIHSVLEYWFANMNRILRNSQTGASLRLVGIEPSPIDGLDGIAGLTTEEIRETGARRTQWRNMDWTISRYPMRIQALRHQYQADLVHVVSWNGANDSRGLCGQASLIRETDLNQENRWWTVMDQTYGFTDLGCAIKNLRTAFGSSIQGISHYEAAFTFAHEIGHNLGLNHARQLPNYGPYDDSVRVPARPDETWHPMPYAGWPTHRNGHGVFINPWVKAEHGMWCDSAKERSENRACTGALSYRGRLRGPYPDRRAGRTGALTIMGYPVNSDYRRLPFFSNPDIWLVHKRNPGEGWLAPYGLRGKKPTMKKGVMLHPGTMWHLGSSRNDMHHPDWPNASPDMKAKNKAKYSVYLYDAAGALDRTSMYLAAYSDLTWDIPRAPRITAYWAWGEPGYYDLDITWTDLSDDELSFVIRVMMFAEEPNIHCPTWIIEPGSTIDCRPRRANISYENRLQRGQFPREVKTQHVGYRPEPAGDRSRRRVVFPIEGELTGSTVIGVQVGARGPDGVNYSDWKFSGGD
ncbi:MAG: M12 family metallo-peptidase [Caldilineaceae bacterium]|nr:M12 family metallo-peptidase [Caldilineaceae bacterium]